MFMSMKSYTTSWYFRNVKWLLRLCALPSSLAYPPIFWQTWLRILKHDKYTNHYSNIFTIPCVTIAIHYYYLNAWTPRSQLYEGSHYRVWNRGRHGDSFQSIAKMRCTDKILWWLRLCHHVLSPWEPLELWEDPSSFDFAEHRSRVPSDMGL